MNSARDTRAPTYPPTAPPSPLHLREFAKWTFLIVVLGWVFTVPLLFNAGRFGLLLLSIIVLATQLVRYRSWKAQPYEQASMKWGESEKLRHKLACQQRATAFLSIAPREFEHAVAGLYRMHGFHVVQTAYVADGGWDLELHRANERLLVECKQWHPNRTVGRPILQKLHSAVITERANGGILVTTAAFSGPAVEFGRAHGIQLIDGPCLARLTTTTFPDADEADVVYGLCSVCARLVAFPGVHEPEQLFGVALNFCPNGHVVGHPFFSDLHPAVSKRAKANHRLVGSRPTTERVSRACQREIMLTSLPTRST